MIQKSLENDAQMYNQTRIETRKLLRRRKKSNFLEEFHKSRRDTNQEYETSFKEKSENLLET